MPLPRRAFVASAAAATLAACGPKAMKPKAPPIVTKLLDRQFPDLADRARPGAFNAGLMSLDSGQTWFWNAERRFPMVDVVAAPLAAAVLAEVDARRAKPEEMVRVTEMDLSPGVSAINRAWRSPADHATRSWRLSELVKLAVLEGDATAIDVLMKRIGGPGALTAWLRNKAIFEMRVDRYLRELRQEMAGMMSFRPAWKDAPAWIAARSTVPPALRETAMNAFLSDPRDTTTVQDALNFLQKLSANELLSKASTTLLLTLMRATGRAARGLKAGLPKGTALAHAPGSSGTDLGFTPAMGDIAVVTLRDGRRYGIAAFLAGSTATEAERDRLFADTAALMAKAAH